MRKLKIGCSSGGCSFERMEPAIDIIENGELDYIIFECLSERTLAEAQKAKLANPNKGYNPMLEERMESIMTRAYKKGIKIISNMGAANPSAAFEIIKKIAVRQKIQGLRVAVVLGDDITHLLPNYQEFKLHNKEITLHELDNVVSANVYLGSEGIVDALKAGADIVITGRIADPSLFVAPILYHFEWLHTEYDKVGQALLLGHLMECCTQITGGFYADPGYKDLEDLHKLGHPIAEIDENGSFFITKLKNTGGAVTIDICKEQLLYEIGNPSEYVTPDGIADFSKVVFREKEKNIVEACNADSRERTNQYKVNVCYDAGFKGVGEISYGGRTALERARLAADIIKKRWEIIGVQPEESKFDYIGYDSLFGGVISNKISDALPYEVRLRISVLTKDERTAKRLLRELQCMYINGPAGSCGITTRIDRLIAIENILVDRSDVKYSVRIEEI